MAANLPRLSSAQLTGAAELRSAGAASPRHHLREAAVRCDRQPQLDLNPVRVLRRHLRRVAELSHRGTGHREVIETGHPRVDLSAICLSGAACSLQSGDAAKPTAPFDSSDTRSRRRLNISAFRCHDGRVYPHRPKYRRPRAGARRQAPAARCRRRRPDCWPRPASHRAARSSTTFGEVGVIFAERSRVMCRLLGLNAGRNPVSASFWLIGAPDSLEAPQRGRQRHRLLRLLRGARR